MTDLDWFAVVLFVLQVPILWLWLVPSAIRIADRLADLWPPEA